MRIADLVKASLRDDPALRDSDRKLLLNVWEKCGFYLSESQRVKFMDLPSAETIRRIRQKIQEKGLYKASESVSRHRKIKGLVIQQNAPKADSNRLNSLFEADNYNIRRHHEHMDN